VPGRIEGNELIGALALQARLEAEVIDEKTQCLLWRAKYAECAAKNESHAAKSGILGCGAGLLAAVFTGGAATPLAAAGCGGGLLVGSATRQACGEPAACTPDMGQIMQQVLARNRLSALPLCQ
jgi:hypothetical protein